MNAFNRQLVLILCLLGVVTVHTKAEVQVQAQVDRSKPIYAGSTFSYGIIVANGGKPDKIDLSALQKYQPANPSSQSRTSMINGQTSSYEILTYQMTAPAEGDYIIPSIDVQVGGTTYKTRPVKISVVKPGTTRQMDVEAKLSASVCYVGQPVVLTLSLYIWTDIVRAEQIANITIQVPFLNEDHFYLEDADFQPEGTKQIVLPVNGQQQYVYQDQVMHNGVNCVQIRYIKVLIPKKAGSLQLKAPSVSADIAVGRKSRSRDSFFDDFFSSQYEYKRFGVQSDPLALEISDLPPTGKPDDFYGLVGSYTITSNAAPTQVNIGDPITLTIKISGSQYLKPVQWPNLDRIPEMADAFKIPSEYADGKIEEGAKIFTQTIRANTDTVTQVPPIPLSFFDATAGEYRTAYSDPIPLQVSPTRIVTGSDVESHGQASPASRQIKAIQEGLSANYFSADALINQRFSLIAALTSTTFIILWISPVVVLCGSLFTRIMLSNSPKRQLTMKRKKACANALKRIRKAEKKEMPVQQISVALKQYIADKFNKTAGSLTGQECQTILLERTNDVELSKKFQEIIDRLEASEYSPLSFQMTHETLEEICNILGEIEKNIK